MNYLPMNFISAQINSQKLASLVITCCVQGFLLYFCDAFVLTGQPADELGPRWRILLVNLFRPETQTTIWGSKGIPANMACSPSLVKIAVISKCCRSDSEVYWFLVLRRIVSILETIDTNACPNVAKSAVYKVFRHETGHPRIWVGDFTPIL